MLTRILRGALPFCVVAGWAVSLSAAEPMEDWINQALDGNPEVVTARMQWEAAKTQIDQVRGLEDPMAGVNVMREDSNRFDDADEIEWMVSQRIPFWGKRKFRGEAARLMAEAAGFQYMEVMRTVRAQVIEASWKLWIAARELEINEEYLSLLAQNAEAARGRYAAGEGGQGDLLRAQVEEATVRNEQADLELEREVIQASLNRLLNLPPDTPQRMDSAPMQRDIGMDLDELYRRARQYCCFLMSYVRLVEAAEYAGRAARRDRAPDFELTVQAREPRGSGGIQEYDTGIAINIPWLWRGKYAAAIREADIERDKALAMLEGEQNMTLFEVKERHTRIDNRRRSLALLNETILPRATELADVMRASYEAGSVTFLEWLDAQRALLDARRRLVRAQGQYVIDYAWLEQIVAEWGPREIETGLVTEAMLAE